MGIFRGVAAVQGVANCRVRDGLRRRQQQWLVAVMVVLSVSVALLSALGRSGVTKTTTTASSSSSFIVFAEAAENEETSLALDDILPVPLKDTPLSEAAAVQEEDTPLSEAAAVQEIDGVDLDDEMDSRPGLGGSVWGWFKDRGRKSKEREDGSDDEEARASRTSWWRRGSGRGGAAVEEASNGEVSAEPRAPWFRRIFSKRRSGGGEEAGGAAESAEPRKRWWHRIFARKPSTKRRSGDGEEAGGAAESAEPPKRWWHRIFARKPSSSAAGPSSSAAGPSSSAAGQESEPAESEPAASGECGVQPLTGDNEFALEIPTPEPDDDELNTAEPTAPQLASSLTRSSLRLRLPSPAWIDANVEEGAANYRKQKTFFSLPRKLRRNKKKQCSKLCDLYEELEDKASIGLLTEQLGTYAGDARKIITAIFKAAVSYKIRGERTRRLMCKVSKLRYWRKEKSCVTDSEIWESFVNNVEMCPGDKWRHCTDLLRLEMAIRTGTPF